MLTFLLFMVGLLCVLAMVAQYVVRRFRAWSLGRATLPLGFKPQPRGGRDWRAVIKSCEPFRERECSVHSVHSAALPPGDVAIMDVASRWLPWNSATYVRWRGTLVAFTGLAAHLPDFNVQPHTFFAHLLEALLTSSPGRGPGPGRIRIALDDRLRFSIRYELYAEHHSEPAVRRVLNANIAEWISRRRGWWITKRESDLLIFTDGRWYTPSWRLRAFIADALEIGFELLRREAKTQRASRHTGVRGKPVHAVCSSG